MTVAELIEELRRFPAHHAVVVRHPEGFSYDTGAVEFGLGSIDEVIADQAFAHKQPLVIVEVAEWCK